LNDSFKSGFFKDESFDTYVKNMSSVNISLELINNLENEYTIDNKLMEIANKNNINIVSLNHK